VSAEYNNVKNDDILLNYFRADPNLYARSQILLDRIAHILLVAPFLIIAFLIADIPLWGVLTTLIMLTGFRLAGEVIQLLMFSKLPVHFGRPWLNNTVSAVMLVAAVIVPVYFNIPDISVILANPIISVISIPVGIFSWFYIKNYTLYRKLQNEKINWFMDQLNKYNAAKGSSNTGTGMYFADAKKWSKSINAEDLESEKDKHKNKKGFAYLNAIFFDRHSNYFKKKIFRRCIFFFLIPVTTIFSVMYLVSVGGVSDLNILDLESIEDSVNGIFAIVPLLLLEVGQDQVFSIAPIFFFIIYLVSLGRVTTASVFTNCDIHMLHYRYYRTRETIFASFKARLSMILKYNLIVTTVINISIIPTLILVFGRIDILHVLVLFALLTVMGAFFAFNDLFLYYVIQPYDSAGKGKSIIYTIINYVIYIVAWINFSLRLDFFIYALIVGVATLLYYGVGTVLLLKLAPKRFKLR